MIQSVMAEDIPAVWPRIEKYIANACKYSGGTLHPDEILPALLARKMQLFVCDNLRGALVTEIQTGKETTIIRGMALGGEFGAWNFGELTETMLEWAKELDAKLEIRGRKGWAKVLKKYGWKQNSIIMEVSI